MIMIKVSGKANEHSEVDRWLCSTFKIRNNTDSIVVRFNRQLLGWVRAGMQCMSASESLGEVRDQERLKVHLKYNVGFTAEMLRGYTTSVRLSVPFPRMASTIIQYKVRPSQHRCDAHL